MKIFFFIEIEKKLYKEEFEFRKEISFVKKYL